MNGKVCKMITSHFRTLLPTYLVVIFWFSSMNVRHEREAGLDTKSRGDRPFRFRATFLKPSQAMTHYVPPE